MGLPATSGYNERKLSELAQRAQYPLIKKYTLNLNYNMKAPIILGEFLNLGVLSSLGNNQGLAPHAAASATRQRRVWKPEPQTDKPTMDLS